MPFWGFNYSEMANYRFLIDSTTFWMISGTSKILSKFGPVALPITTKLLQKYKNKYGDILEKYYLWKSETQFFFDFLGSPVFPQF